MAGTAYLSTQHLQPMCRRTCEPEKSLEVRIVAAQTAQNVAYWQHGAIDFVWFLTIHTAHRRRGSHRRRLETGNRLQLAEWIEQLNSGRCIRHEYGGMQRSVKTWLRLDCRKGGIRQKSLRIAAEFNGLCDVLDCLLNQRLNPAWQPSRTRRRCSKIDRLSGAPSQGPW